MKYSLYTYTSKILFGFIIAKQENKIKQSITITVLGLMSFSPLHSSKEKF